MKGLITICARGGSKGIPGKNIKVINGKPLIAYTIDTAVRLKEKYNIDIILSTDSIEIKSVVESLQESFIDTSYVRPEYLAGDTVGKMDAIIDAKKYAEKNQGFQYDFLIDMDVTSPLRTVEDLDKSIKKLFDNNKSLNIFSVSPANRNPYFNMVEEKKDGFVNLCKTGSFLTRQSAPKVYDLNASFYIFKNAFFEKQMKTPIGDSTLVYEVPHLCFDLDHPIDFEFMEFLIQNRKLDFDFNY